MYHETIEGREKIPQNTTIAVYQKQLEERTT